MASSPKLEQKSSTAVLTFILWLLTAVLGIQVIIVTREMLFSLFSRFTVISQSGYEAFLQANTAGAAGIFLIIILSVLWIAAVIGGGEYYYRHVGQPSSWRLLTRILAVEISILLLALFI